jgi:hypothetical protein
MKDFGDTLSIDLRIFLSVASVNLTVPYLTLIGFIMLPSRLDRSTQGLIIKNEGDLSIDRHSRFHFNYLCASSIEEHSLWVVELAIVDPNLMVLITYDFKTEFSV